MKGKMRRIEDGKKKGMEDGKYEGEIKGIWKERMNKGRKKGNTKSLRCVTLACLFIFENY
jgi:hypothetical protein